ncbi:unnamed protein product [Bursaphelenchus okinawaensis]|uniref:non-specific serine/threonine protein kinase n=1 Tax=Bursaphelenchus okinawaensis TaxID=465554 RepID=A0A811LNX9_9BILA|nr:unnamed protein product [Bursaphelenchus okinawaensis]CAG9127248.1 unnamed protein product [Bursaphelenchus okinawaensis]
MNSDHPNEPNFTAFMDESFTNNYRARKPSNEVQPVSIPRVVAQSSLDNNELYSSLKCNLEKAKENTYITPDRVVPLDHEQSKNLYQLIYEASPLKDLIPFSTNPEHIFPVLDTYKEWENFAIMLGGIYNRILDLQSLKEVCGWIFIVSGYILSPKYESEFGIDRQVIFDKLSPLFVNILKYTSAQFLADNLTCHISYFGQRYFDQIFGMIDYKILAGSFSEYRIDAAINYLSNMANLLTAGCVEHSSMASETQIRNDTLKLFFIKYSCFILPRIFFSKYFATYKAKIMHFIESHVDAMTTLEDYFGKNLAFIFDYFMLNRSVIPEDQLTSAVYHFTGHSLEHYVKRNTFQSMLVCIFHLGTNRDVSLKMLKRIASAKYVDWSELVKNQFLGLMIDLRQYMIEQPYFGQRKKEIAMGLAVFVKEISSVTVNTYVAKICHTLWILNSPNEHFGAVWKVLITKLDMKNLIQMRYKLLFYFLQVSEFKDLAHTYLKELDRKKITNRYESERTEIRLLYSAIFGIPNSGRVNTNVAEIALKAMENNVHLTPFILPIISQQLLVDYSDKSVMAKLLDRVFELAKQANTILELSTLATFIGRITAVDPRQLMDTVAWKDESPKSLICLTLDEVEFVRRFVKDTFRWHIEAPSGGQSDMAALCLQYLCAELKAYGSKYGVVREEMPELGPYETATIVARSVAGYYEVPISGDAHKGSIKNHSMWLVQWFRVLTKELKTVPFTMLDSLSKCFSGEEMPFLYEEFLPIVILQCCIEFPASKVTALMTKEATSVFVASKKRSEETRADINESCQTIFSIFDELYRVILKEKDKKLMKLKEGRLNIASFVEDSLKFRQDPLDAMPASVYAAECCDNFYRAQRVLEQYAIARDHRGMPKYNRSIYSLVQSLNFNLQEVENNEGAFEMIMKHDKPTDLQVIKCAYARGDFHEILPMISNENREFMVQFLQVFNQPQLVLYFIECSFTKEEQRLLKRDYPDVYQAKCQAAVELGKWDLIETDPVLESIEELTPRIAEVDVRPDYGIKAVDSRNKKSETIRLENDDLSQTITSKVSESEILAFVSDIEDSDDESKRDLPKLEGNGDGKHGNDALSETRKRLGLENDAVSTKKPRLSTTKRMDNSLYDDDTEMMFKENLEPSEIVVDNEVVIEGSPSSLLIGNETSNGEQEAGSKKTEPSVCEHKSSSLDLIEDKLDRWELMLKYHNDDIKDNAKRCYNDYDDRMEVLEALTTWTPYDDYDPVYDSPVQHTFLSDLAVILEKCRRKKFEEAKKHLKLIQVYLMKTLGQQGVDNTRPYIVGYEFVQNLHTLEDLKCAVPELSDNMSSIWGDVGLNQTEESIVELQIAESAGSQARTIKDILNVWNKRDKLVRQTPRDLEPILRNRRNILRSLSRPDIEGEVKEGLTKLLVQSSRLARENDMTHTVLPYLTEAKKDGCNMLDLEVERAYYYMEKKDSSENPVQIMSAAVADYFPLCWQLLKDVTEPIVDTKKRKSTSTKTLSNIGAKEDVKKWEESMVSMLDMMSSEQISGSPKLLKLCKHMETLGATTELFFYRFAMFVDGAYEVPHDQAARLLIRLCIETMKRGDTYQYDVMPRMITAWLDTARELNWQKKLDGQKGSSAQSLHESAKSFVTETTAEPHSLVLQAFNELSSTKFYIVFSLLATRLSKAERVDAEVIKHIMKSLLVEYPHHCALLAMGEARCSTKKFGDRAAAMSRVLDEVKRSERRVKPLIEMYKFLADNLSKISSIKVNSDVMDMQINFSEFVSFIHTGHRQPLPLGKRPSPPSVPMFFKYLDEPFKEVPKGTVFIHKVVNECNVINSLARPKRLTLIGSDGEKYIILCKPTDELRKDMRFLELASMLNRKMQTSRYTRNRDYRIRTYHVIPLEETGGIIEWVPHMDTLNNCIRNGNCKNRDLLLKIRDSITKNRFKKQELHSIYMQKLIPLFQTEMGLYLRKTSLNPSAYYEKQRNYTVTTAAMSALGHIVGLGDRHLGNILVDGTNGDVMHVDFNLLFNSGEMLTVPEIVPFRLTRNVVDGFGPTGVEGRFRCAFERIIKFLKSEKPAILRVLKSFIYDPLIDWRIDEDNDHSSYARRSSNNNISVQDRIELVRDRLDGYLHTTIQPKIGPINDERVLVSKLMEMAMDEESLSQMYFGWSPFV